MEKALGKIKSKLDSEFDEHRNMNKLYEYYQKSLPAMQEQLVVSILEGKVTGERAKNMLGTYEFPLLFCGNILCRCKRKGNRGKNGSFVKLIAPGYG